MYFPLQFKTKRAEFVSLFGEAHVPSVKEYKLRYNGDVKALKALVQTQGASPAKVPE